MPEEVKDRFKALKVLTDKLNDIDDQMDVAYHALEVKYESQYAEIYKKRTALIKGDVMPDEESLARYEELKSDLIDGDYEKLEVPICNVKDIQNTQKGVSGFFLKALLMHEHFKDEITEKDRAILEYLEDIKVELHVKGFGYTLTFIFEPNAYFEGTVLTKTFIMAKPNVVEKCIGMEIPWTAGSDPTMEKKKKKQKVGGKTKTVTKLVKIDSFFNFFDTVEAANLDNASPMEQGDDEEEEKKTAELMDEHYDTGHHFKDDIIPLALEYVLGVVQQEEEDDDEDSDEEEKPKKGLK